MGLLVDWGRFAVSRARRALPDLRPSAEVEKALSLAGTGSGGWWPMIRESFAGAWQRNVEFRTEAVIAYSTLFRVLSLIPSDIGKMRLRLIERHASGVWQEVGRNNPFAPVLRKPNRYQNAIQFVVTWVESKLIHGNTYVLKERDRRGIVRAMYVLSPQRVQVLVAPDGSVFYQLSSDHLAGLPEDQLTVPASEVIHDRWNTFFHPLVGLSPILAAGLAAMQGLRIQQNSEKFFASGAHPGGVLTAPGHIDDATARRLKEYWDTNYGGGGPNVGRVAVLGDGLKYEPMMMTATDAQLLEQLKWTAETVAATFGVPSFMVGVGQPPTYNNIEALLTEYYSQCLQIHIESIEMCLDEGLGLRDAGYAAEFDLEDLLRMDSASKMRVAGEGVQRAIYSPNEARAKFQMLPVEGGETPFLQQQNWPLAHLASRPLPERSLTDSAPIDDGQRTVPAADDRVITLDKERLRRKAKRLDQQRRARSA